MDCVRYDDIVHENAVLQEAYNQVLEDIKNIKSEKRKVITEYNDLWNVHRKILEENKKLRSDISDLRGELGKLSKIEIGDKIEVTNAGNSYPKNYIWLENNAPILLPLFVIGEFVDGGECGTVLAIGEGVGEIIYAFVNEDGKVRLIGRDGIKLVEKSNT